MVDADSVIQRFGEDIGAWVRREKRVAMRSPLYDLPGRSFLGFCVVRAIAPELIAQLDALVPPEELGLRMRVPLGRPYVLQGIMVIEGQLMARQQEILDRGDEARTAEDAERTERVISWFARTFSAYRVDAEPWASGARPVQRILEPEDAEPWLVLDAALERDAARIQRALGTLELYALTLHGEQRDGNFDHGPYALDDGRWAAFHELNDLRNDVLPWSTPEVRLPVDAVGVVRVYGAEVEPRFELFGTMSTAPSAAPFATHALLVREGAVVRRAGVEELEALAEQAMAATTALYSRIAVWDDDFRTAYGAPLFVNHLVPFARLAGLDGSEGWMGARAAEVTAQELSRLRGGVPTSVWQHLGDGGGEMFSPVGRGS